jgi:hypothetical protein
MNEFGRYCLMMFRQMRQEHWSAMLRHRYTKDPAALRIARRYRLEAHRYAQKAREHGYGKRIAA